MKKRRLKTVSKSLLISTLFLIYSSNELKSFKITVCFFFVFFVSLKNILNIGKCCTIWALCHKSVSTWPTSQYLLTHMKLNIHCCISYFRSDQNSSAVTSNNLFFVFISLPNLIISLRRTDSGNILVYLTFQTYSCWKISDLSLHLILQITGSVSCIHWITINYHFRIFWENINFYYLDWQGPFG